MNGDGLTLGESISLSLGRLVKWVVVLTVVLVGCAAAAGLYAKEQSDTAAQTKAALCALRADLEARVGAGRQFLIDNPDGIPGISAEAIQQSINDRMRTIDALSSLDCQP